MSNARAEDSAETRRDEMLVGVDGSRAATAAARWAAIEADRLGASLRLLHVVPTLAIAGLPGAPETAGAAKVDAALRHRRDRIFGAPAEAARAVLAGDRIQTDMIGGERVPTLLAEAAHARAVILGAPWHPRVDRLITGSVVGGVAARASVPVIGVPEDWASEHERGRVIAAVKQLTGADSEHLVAEAAQIALARKCRLTVLHAWEFPVVYDNMLATTEDEQAWNDIKRDLLTDLLRQATDGVETTLDVDFRVVHDQGAHALVAASTEADLIVIHRRHRAFPFGHLGGPGRAILRESRCPVEVLPPVGPAAPPAAGQPAADR